jgi:acyl carrier protein
MKKDDAVLELIAAVLRVSPEEIQEDDGAHSVGNWDSLRSVLMASMIEVNYGVTLSNEEIEQLISVQGVRQVVGRHAGTS